MTISFLTKTAKWYQKASGGTLHFEFFYSQKKDRLEGGFSET